MILHQRRFLWNWAPQLSRPSWRTEAQTECDYVLPNGLHSDTHINLGRICRSESTLAPIVRVLDEMLTGRNFDTLVSTSWALATIARRLVLRRSALPSRGIRHVTVEG